MKYCDDCKWCSVNFAATDGYDCPETSDDAGLYKCMHPESSKSARYDCRYCNSMRQYGKCGKQANLFEEKEKVLPQDQVNETQPKKPKNPKKRYRLFDIVETVLLTLTVYNGLIFAGFFWVALWRREGLGYSLAPFIAMGVFLIAAIINNCCMDKYDS